jgi:3-hydroxyisobutyrate dehydrogenase
MTIAMGEAERMGTDLPGLRLAKGMYETLAAHGHSRDGTQALFEYYDR